MGVPSWPWRGTHHIITQHNMDYPIQSCLVLLSILSVTLTVPTPDWEEYPLTTGDLRLVQVGADVPITTTTNNQTCHLTPATSTESSCTWRMSQNCKKVPTIISVPVYSPWCTEGGIDQHLTQCKEKLSVVPLVHNVRVCTPSGTPDCRGPCYNCDQYCEPALQTWCEVSHSISTLVSEKRECREVDGEECKDVLIRMEKDVVKSSDNCYEKNVELCGPVNCKFVNITKECHDKNNTMQVELRERECVVCEPTLAEKVKVEEVCEDFLTNDCKTDPLSRTWKKFCNTEKSDSIEIKKFRFDDVEEPRSLNSQSNDKFSVEDLINQSLGPVNNLVFETLKQIHVDDLDSSNPVIITEKPEETEVDDLSAILKLLEEEKKIVKEEVNALKESQLNPTTINVNVQFEPTGANFSREPKSNVYFDPILNTLNPRINNGKVLTTTSKYSSQSSPPSLTELLDKQLQSQFFPTTTYKPSTLPESTPIVPIKVTQPPRPSDTIPDQTIETYISTTVPAQTTVTHSTKKPKESVKQKRKLSPAEFLRLCFTSRTGCDFSQNEVDSTSETPTTTITTTTTTTITPKHVEKSVQDRLKQRVKLCFFSGLCSDSDLRRLTTTKTTTTVATTRLTTTRSPRSAEIQKRVLERARACFFEGKCN